MLVKVLLVQVHGLVGVGPGRAGWQECKNVGGQGSTALQGSKGVGGQVAGWQGGRRAGG